MGQRIAYECDTCGVEVPDQNDLSQVCIGRFMESEVCESCLQGIWRPVDAHLNRKTLKVVGNE